MATDMLPKFDPTQVFAAKIVYSQTEGSMFTKAKAAIMAAYPKAKVTGETSQNKSGTFDIMAKGKNIFSKEKGDGDLSDNSSKLSMLTKLYGAVQGGSSGAGGESAGGLGGLKL